MASHFFIEFDSILFSKMVFGLCVVASEQKLKEGAIRFPKKTEKLPPPPHTHTLKLLPTGLRKN